VKFSLPLPQVHDARIFLDMELYSANRYAATKNAEVRYAVNTNAEIRNAATKCAGRMNAANVNRPDETTNAKNENARNAKAASMNAASMNDRNSHAGNRENETARNYASLNANATNTNAASATEIITNANGSNLSAERREDATRKPSMTFSAIFSDGNEGRRINHEINL